MVWSPALPPTIFRRSETRTRDPVPNTAPETDRIQYDPRMNFFGTTFRLNKRVERDVQPRSYRGKPCNGLVCGTVKEKTPQQTPVTREAFFGWPGNSNPGLGATPSSSGVYSLRLSSYIVLWNDETSTPLGSLRPRTSRSTAVHNKRGVARGRATRCDLLLGCWVSYSPAASTTISPCIHGWKMHMK